MPNAYTYNLQHLRKKYWDYEKKYLSSAYKSYN